MIKFIRIFSISSRLTSSAKALIRTVSWTLITWIKSSWNCSLELVRGIEIRVLGCEVTRAVTSRLLKLPLIARVPVA